MSEARRTPPPSPRAPRIQSWDDCGTPPVDLFDPSKQSPPVSPSRHCFEPPKSPKTGRRLPNLDQVFFSKKVVRKFDSSNSEPCSSHEYYLDGEKSPGNIHRMAHKGTGSLGEANSPIIKSPHKKQTFIYDAISPKFEANKNFDFCESLNRDENYSGKGVAKKREKRPVSSRKFDCKMTSSDDDQMSEFSIRNRPTKHHSIVTESSFSGDSEFSTTTTALCSTVSEKSRHNSSTTDIINEDLDESSKSDLRTRSSRNVSEDDYCKTSIKNSRRHAINITSNPGYQAIHNSHIKLDRTCSDSLVIRRCSRKSTSDLTDSAIESEPVKPKVHRRRESSKGGLAFLASRRESRDSMKSHASNTSLFSNEDLGPLTFQASARGRQRRTSNFLELPVPDHIRPRVCSLPERPYNPRQSEDLYRLRTFSISKGTVVNCGDSIISRRSRSNTSVNSTTSRASERSPFDGSCCGYTVVESLPPSPTDSELLPPPRYRVVMLGDASVGKTALVSQFMTSEYMNTYDASLDDEFGEKTISILLDGEESEMIFIDHPSSEMSVENSLSTYEPHGCIVVYSVVARNSFRVAEEIINYLWQENVTREKAVILVGNKADLARSRVITATEGKSLAQSRDSKFIETSSGIQHNVDELLVGILKQIRLKETRDKKAVVCSTKMRNSRTHISLHLAKEILQKICLSDITKSKSCENLHVL